MSLYFEGYDARQNLDQFSLSNPRDLFLGQAVEAFEAIVAQRPDDPEGPKMLAKLYHQLDQPERAVAVLEAYIRDFPLATDLTHVNILCELYMEVRITTLATSNTLLEGL